MFLHTSGKSLSVGEIHDAVKNLLGVAGLAHYIQKRLRCSRIWELSGAFISPTAVMVTRSPAASIFTILYAWIARVFFDFYRMPGGEFRLLFFGKNGDFRIRDHFRTAFSVSVKNCREQMAC